ncbi:glycosyltransferase [Methylobacterium sp. ap11]|uniref:glycosyltransferase n=1 Tax=Methylobacterium sp. ap11 TaxID=1761799 RepID=UPI0015A50540|nr:glycosyltransferase [Methylobacterium sp. ap11]
MYAEIVSNGWDVRFRSLFDHSWYVERYGSFLGGIDTNSQEEIYDFYVEKGFRLNHNPNPVFDCIYYRANFLIYDTEVCDLYHYMNNVKKGIRNSPHWIYAEDAYLKYNPDIKHAVDQREIHSGYLHFMSVQDVEVRRFSNLFNSYFYAKKRDISPQVAVRDFLTAGIYDGISPSPLFDGEWYRSQIMNDERRNSYSGGPYEHFLREGLGRGVSSIPDFDENYYLKTYPDIENAVRSGNISSAFSHFLTDGIDEYRNPNQYMNLKIYKESNPDIERLIKKKFYNSYFEHFIDVGFKEGRNIGNDLRSIFADSDSTKIAFSKIAFAVANKVARRKPVELPLLNKAKISIVIPVYNQVEMTIQCIESIRSSDFKSYEIVVVDNGSTDDTVNLEKYYKNLKYVRAQSNGGYVGGCNLGATHSTGDIVVFANNDIVVLPDAITNIVAFLDDKKDAGAIGGQIISTSGVLQEAGCAVWADGSTFGYGRGDDPSSFRYSYPRKVDFCSGCFLAVRRSTLDKVGLFDEIFKPGYYEETDLCARIYQAGSEVWYVPGVQVIHYEYASFSKGRPPQASHGMILSRKQMFCDKQKKFLSEKSFPSLAGRHLVADLSFFERPTVIIVEDLIPLRWIGSGFSRTNDAIKALSLDGINVVVVVCNRASRYEHETQSSDIHGAKIVYADEMNYDLEGFIESIPNLLAIQVCRAHNANRFSKSLKAISTLRKRPVLILDTEAVACVREEFGSLPDNYKDNLYLKAAVRRELAVAEYFDKVVYVNELDRNIAEISGIKNKSLILSGTAEVAEGIKSFEERRDFLFIGAMHGEWTPNYQSLEWFVTDVLPLIRKALPNAVFNIAGFWHEKLPKPQWLSADGVHYLGMVPDTNVPMNDHRVFVVPTLSAAGIPQKCVEAISRGIPMVVTDVIGKQIGEADGQMFLTADDAESFAEKCIELYTGADLWRRLSDGSLKYAAGHFSFEAFSRNLIDAVRS